jgi:hypothetical protein
MIIWDVQIKEINLINKPFHWVCFSSSDDCWHSIADRHYCSDRHVRIVDLRHHFLHFWYYSQILTTLFNNLNRLPVKTKYPEIAVIRIKTTTRIHLHNLLWGETSRDIVTLRVHINHSRNSYNKNWSVWSRYTQTVFLMSYNTPFYHTYTWLLHCYHKTRINNPQNVGPWYLLCICNKLRNSKAARNSLSSSGKVSNCYCTAVPSNNTHVQRRTSNYLFHPWLLKS